MMKNLKGIVIAMSSALLNVALFTSSPCPLLPSLHPNPHAISSSVQLELLDEEKFQDLFSGMVRNSIKEIVK